MGPVDAADLKVVQKLHGPCSVNVSWSCVTDLAIRKNGLLIYDINYKDSWWDDVIKVKEERSESDHNILLLTHLRSFISSRAVSV